MPRPEQPSYEELAARNAELLAVVAGQAELIESLRSEVAALRRRVGRDSSNSSQPPSQDSPAAKAKSGQRDRRRARPGLCGGCGGDLAGAEGRVASAVQVFDVPPAALLVTEYQMLRRTCGCGQVTTAAAPAGVSG